MQGFSVIFKWAYRNMFISGTSAHNLSNNDTSSGIDFKFDSPDRLADEMKREFFDEISVHNSIGMQTLYSI